MSLTLAELMNMPIMEHSELLTKTHHLQTPVNWISIMEAPDIIRWIRENTIILTSLYCVYDDPDKMELFLTSIRGKKPAAIMIKLGLYVDEVPAPLMELAKSLDFAIISIANDLQYTDILYPVMAAIFDSQIIPLNYYKDTQSLLMDYALKNAGIDGIARAFSKMIRSAVCVYDRGMYLLFSSGDAPQIKKRIWISSGLQNGIPCDTAQISTADGRSYIEQVSPIRVMEETVGYLGVIEKERTLSELDYIAMQNALAMLSMEMLKKYAVREAERNLNIGILEEILSGKHSGDLWNRAAAVGLYQDREYLVMYIAYQQPQQQNHIFMPGRSLEDYITTCLSAHNLSGVAMPNKNRVTLLIEASSSGKKQPTQILNQIANELSELIGSLPDIQFIALGYSIQPVPLEYVKIAYERAHKAADICRITKESHCGYEELGIFGILGNLTPGQSLADLLPSALQTLCDYDKTHGCNLVETLYVYVSNNRNANRTAQELYVHPKTILYRLNRIAEVAEIDYNNYVQMLNMEFGLQILQILEKENP